jgi:hypothetical protein
MNAGPMIEKLGTILVILGMACIAFIVLSILLTGSWSQSPEIVQMWGDFIRPIGDVPVLGNLTWLIWCVVFIGPGLLVRYLGEKMMK